MAEVYVTLGEAAELERVKYNTMVKRVLRKQESFVTKTEKSENGGKDVVLVAVSSLSKQARNAWKEREKLKSFTEEFPDKKEDEQKPEVPWYVNTDVDWYIENYKERYYKAVELGNVVRKFLQYDEGDRTKYAEEFAQKYLGKGQRTLYRYTKLSYYDLMEIKVSEGTASFNSELQNDPIDPESATFNPEWFDYYEPELVDFSSPEFVFVAANDPSLGKNKKSDTSSIINLALSTKTGYMYVADASVERRKPDVIIDDVFEMNRRLKRDYKKGFYKFGVEVVQFQYFFKEVMAAKSAEEGEYIPIEEIQSTVNKVLRIESLQPVIKNKYLKFNREHKTLLKQLQEFPMGKNDDAPDGLQMAVQLAQTVKAVASKANYKTVLRRRFRMGKGAY